jgi:hypothetical protein
VDIPPEWAKFADGKLEVQRIKGGADRLVPDCVELPQVVGPAVVGVTSAPVWPQMRGVTEGTTWSRAAARAFDLVPLGTQNLPGTGKLHSTSIGEHEEL